MSAGSDSKLDVVASVEDYGRLVARIRLTGSLEVALQRSDVLPEAFEKAQLWARRIADEVASGAVVLAQAFAAGFEAESAASAIVAEPPPPEVATPPSRRSVLGASNAAAVEPEPLARSAQAAPSVADDPAWVDATIEGSAAASGPVLPFDETATPSLGFATARRAPDLVDDDDALDSTRSIEVRMPAIADLPFDPKPPSMPIEQFSSLMAALHAFPEKRAVILGRYGLHGEPALTALVAYFERVFESDPKTKEAFARRLEELSARLVKSEE